MEREGPEVMVRLMRSIRSLAYNRELKPLVEDRIERAEASLRGYLLTNGLAATRVGPYQVEMDEEGDISLTRLPVDDWQQLPLPQLNGSREPSSTPDVAGDLTGFDGYERLLVQDDSSLFIAGRRPP
jgi:hypothetical protein